MRAKVAKGLAALAAGGVLLGGGCYRAVAPVRDVNCLGALTRASEQVPEDIAGPRVDPRTRTGAVAAAGSIPDEAAGRSALSLEAQEPERQQVEHGFLPRGEARGLGGSGAACP